MNYQSYRIPVTVFGSICQEICLYLNFYGRIQEDICKTLDKSSGNTKYFDIYKQMARQINIDAHCSLNFSSVPVSTYVRIITENLTKNNFTGMLEMTMRFVSMVTKPDRKNHYIFRTSDGYSFSKSIQELEAKPYSELTLMSQKMTPGSIIDVDCNRVEFENVLDK